MGEVGRTLFVYLRNYVVFLRRCDTYCNGCGTSHSRYMSRDDTDMLYSKNIRTGLTSTPLTSDYGGTTRSTTGMKVTHILMRRAAGRSHGGSRTKRHVRYDYNEDRATRRQIQTNDLRSTMGMTRSRRDKGQYSGTSRGIEGRLIFTRHHTGIGAISTSKRSGMMRRVRKCGGRRAQSTINSGLRGTPMGSRRIRVRGVISNGGRRSRNGSYGRNHTSKFRRYVPKGDSTNVPRKRAIFFTMNRMPRHTRGGDRYTTRRESRTIMHEINQIRGYVTMEYRSLLIRRSGGRSKRSNTSSLSTPRPYGYILVTG